MFALPRRLIVIGDIHGDIDRLYRCLVCAKILDNNGAWIANPPDTYVVQMGDQLDSSNRTPEASLDWERISDVQVLQAMDQLDECAKQHGGRVLSLIGNHEVMNIFGEFSYVSPKSLQASGGADARRLMFARGGSAARLLQNRYIVLKIGTYLFSHAGILPVHLNLLGENIDELNAAFIGVLTGICTPWQQELVSQLILPMTGVLWTRRYFQMVSDESLMAALANNLAIVLKTTKCSTMFIGHNTMPRITVVANGGLVFTDACFSRAYGSHAYQFIDIQDGNMNVVQVNE